MEKPYMDVLFDMQFGSTGKGALSGYLSQMNEYQAVVSANMPNAGHTAYCPTTGQKFIHKVLPSGIFSSRLEVVAVGPGAVFDIDRLAEEWEAVDKYLRGDVTLVIHEAAGILRSEHREIEQRTLSRISSTMQGSAEALIAKIRREPIAIAKNNGLQIMEKLKGTKVVIVDQAEWLTVFASKKSILLEGSQGYSLGISSGFYPYCTSRECTPARIISDCGLPIGWLNMTYGSCRVHPIRVGNTPDGYSGDWYFDQVEIHFSDLGVPDETTTVTGRVRRVATFSEIQIREAMQVGLPDAVFLNFYQYDKKAGAKAHEAINRAAKDLGCGGVKFIGHGPRPADIEMVP